MIFEIITCVLIIAIFTITVLNLVKKNNTDYLSLLIIEFIGIFTAFMFIITNNKINAIGYIIVYFFSVCIPASIYLIQLMGIKTDELLVKIKIVLNRKKEKEILLDTINKNPKSYVLHKMMANYYEKNKDAEKAEDEYIKAIRYNENDEKNYMNLAELFRQDNKKSMAIDILENLLKIKPEYTKGSILLGELLYDENRFKEAIIVYNNAIKFKPSDYDLYYNMAMTYTRLNDFQNAKQYYKKAATLNSLKDISNLNIGQINMIFRDYESAEKYFFETIKSEDNIVTSNAYIYLAKIRIIQNNEQQAINYANLSLEINPSIIKYIERDEVLNSLIGKIEVKKEKPIKTKIKEKDEKVIEHLKHTYSITEKLTNNSLKKDFNEIEK